MTYSFLFAEPSYLSSDTQQYKVNRRYQSIIISTCWYCGEQIRHQKYRMDKKQFSRTVHGPCMHQHTRNKRKHIGRYGI